MDILIIGLLIILILNLILKVLNIRYIKNLEKNEKPLNLIDDKCKYNEFLNVIGELKGH